MKWMMAGALALVGACATGAPAVIEDAAAESRPIRIASNDVALAGELALPADVAPVVGVVLLAGSGPASRDMLRPSAERLAARGVAAIYYDKRGVGDSDGDWAAASLADLARDARAAASALSDATGVPEDRIGYWGHSQGVWVALKAIDLGARPAFVLALSGGGLGPRAIETRLYRLALEHAGASDAELRAGLEVVDTYFAYLDSKASLAEFQSARDAISGFAWADALRFPLPSEDGRRHWAWVTTFDPGPIAAASEAPTLVVLGGDDRNLPVIDVAAAWNAALAASPARGDEIVLLPGLDHHLNSPPAAGAHAAADDHGDGFVGLTSDPVLWDRLADFATRRAGDVEG